MGLRLSEREKTSTLSPAVGATSSTATTALCLSAVWRSRFGQPLGTACRGPNRHGVRGGRPGLRRPGVRSAVEKTLVNPLARALVQLTPGREAGSVTGLGQGARVGNHSVPKLLNRSSPGAIPSKNSSPASCCLAETSTKKRRKPAVGARGPSFTTLLAGNT